ncbi:hypothetical protein [Acinetobacter silvestris]|uniref:Spore coat protein U domain-containing protein n=1 Tax=Acinetobacter silvestris TaxID=1977882 RepID=A0A1Y3CP59_9GAMM|nr:hypothetical protein [Acinetobacter silvestris]OTG67396.1 hypothetical protein B9T28_01855 [Acinetobacter silvestris]
MNKMTQAALAAVVLGACSTAVFADDAAKPGDNGPDFSRCTELGCSKDIPITLEVPKKCTVSGGSPIILSSAGGTKTSNYAVESNTHYVLELSTANTGFSNSTYVKNGTNHISTTIKTNGGGLVNAGMGTTNHTGLGTDNYVVSVTNAATTASNAAGTYSDTYRIRVSY